MTLSLQGNYGRVEMSNSVLQIRLDSKMKKDAIKLYQEIGLDLSTAIRLFINKSLLTRYLPFDIEKSNSNKISKRTFHEEDLNKYMNNGEPL